METDSSDSDSVELMTPLTTRTVGFHQVASAPTSTLSLVKTSLKVVTIKSKNLYLSLFEVFNMNWPLTFNFSYCWFCPDSCVRFQILVQIFFVPADSPDS